MKKLFSAAAVIMICLMISCNDSGSSSSTSGNDQNAQNLEKNRKVLKGIETGDSSLINPYIADDAVDHQGPHGDIKGGDSIRHMLADMHNHVKDIKFDVIADAANGDYIFCLSKMTGTMNDDSWGMPAGTKMDEKGVDVIKIKDGKMVEHWGFVDPAAMMKHMQESGGNKMEGDKMKADSTKK
jgi:predicted ester cyclase